MEWLLVFGFVIVVYLAAATRVSLTGTQIALGTIAAIASPATLHAQRNSPEVLAEMQGAVAFQLDSDEDRQLGRWRIVGSYFGIAPEEGRVYHTVALSRMEQSPASMYSVLGALCWKEDGAEPECRTIESRPGKQDRLNRLARNKTGGVIAKQSLQLRRTGYRADPFWVILCDRFTGGPTQYVWLLVDALSGESQVVDRAGLPEWVDPSPVLPAGG